MRLTCVLVAMVLGLGLIAGCGGGSGKSNQTATGPAGPSSKDSGDFVLNLEAPQSADDQTAAGFIKDTGTPQAIVDAMNGLIALPADITVTFTSTDQGPAYDPATRKIVIGYPFVTYVSQTFADGEPDLSDQALAAKTDDVIGFVMLHEMGHALVDQLNIPITGREEDSVDNLATVILVEGLGADGGDVALDFADFFGLLQKDPAQLQAVDFWDEHSLDAQRANDTSCLVYGSDPSSFGDLQQFIPDSRLQRCPDEWVQARASWEKLLGPSLKP